jgi:DNA-binding MarR family transcriptional regulator
MNSQGTQSVLNHWREAVPEDRLAHLIKDATRSLIRALQFRLSDHNVSFGHWAFLRILWEQDGLTQRELSERAGVMEPTTFAAMKAMESLGYIERRYLPGNKKNLHVYLTRTGKALKKHLVPLAEEVNAIGTHSLKASEVEMARKVLLTLIGNLAEDEAA